MNFSVWIDLLKKLETSRVFEYLQSLNIGELIHNPWFLGGMGGLAVLALIMRWRLLLATILGVSGFVGLISYTLQRDTAIGGLGNQTLLIFVAGGVALIFIVIYLLFIKAE